MENNELEQAVTRFIGQAWDELAFAKEDLDNGLVRNSDFRDLQYRILRLLLAIV